MKCFNPKLCNLNNIKCAECQIAESIYGYHPYYSQVPFESGEVCAKKMIEKVKIFHGTDPEIVEMAVNNFTRDKNVVDILYQAAEIAKPPYVSDRVMVIYKEAEEDGQESD